MNAWGKLAVFNCYRCNPYSIRCPTRITEFSKTLVKRIDMVAYGQPKVIHFGSGNKAGYTLVQLIETSNITAHFCEEDNKAFIDVFSCKYFDSNEVKKVIQEFFQPHHIHSEELLREAYPEMK